MMKNTLYLATNALHCHTERSEVSQSLNNRDFSLSTKAQNDKVYCHTERMRSIHKELKSQILSYGYFATLNMTMGWDFLRTFAINLINTTKRIHNEK